MNQHELDEMAEQIRKMMEPVFRKQNRALLVAHALSGLLSQGTGWEESTLLKEAFLLAEVALDRLDATDRH